MSRRYTLRDPEIFRWIMEHPGTGIPYSVRSLADAAGVTRGLVERLLNGTQRTADINSAHSLTEALGVTVLVLFAPSTSTKQDTVSPDHDTEEEESPSAPHSAQPPAAPRRLSLD